MCFFVPEKGHPYPGLAMTGIVTLLKNLAKFGFIYRQFLEFVLYYLKMTVLKR